MPNPLNVHGWIAGADKRLKQIEEYLQAQHQYQKQIRSAPGLSGADDRSIQVLKRGYEVLRQEFDELKTERNTIALESSRLRTILSGVESFSTDMQTMDMRLRQLAYHTGVYDEIVQGTAIRPERAVPAVRINQKTGAAEINPVKVHTKTFWLASTPRTIVVPANGNAQVSFVVPPEQNLEGDLEIFYLELASCTSTSFRVRLNHTGLGGKYLMNAPVHGLAVFGNMNAGCQPFQMYESVFLEPNMELIVEIQDFSGAPNTIELITHGRKFMGYAIDGMDRIGLINVFARNTWPFWLTTDRPVALADAAGTPTLYNMTLERQIHAELCKVMRFGTIGGVAAPVDYRMTMSEGSSGSLLIDNAPINCVGGNSNFPFTAPEPYLALRGTLLTGNMTPTTSVVGQVVDFAWHGRALPLSFAGQRALEPLLDGRNVQLPPASNKDLAIPRMVSV